MKPCLGRLVTLAIFLASACLPAAAYADDVRGVNNQAVVAGETAAQCYDDATLHLSHGEWFERAMAQLKEASRQDPKNPDYHMALGCAYADRAASLGYAEGFALYHQSDIAQYEATLTDWKKAQLDPKSDDYGKPQPVEPPAFTPYTKDDLHSFTMTTPQVQASMAELGKEALGEWSLAISLTSTPIARAHAEYVQGWGMVLLSEYRTGDPLDWTGASGLGVPSLPQKSDAAKSFTAATTDDPGNATYWESLGDSLGQPTADTGAALQSVEAGRAGQSMAAYRKSLALDPKNATLWWYLGQYEVASGPGKADPDLRQAIAADPTNALPYYVLAESEIEQTRYKNTIANHQAILPDHAAAVQVDIDMDATLTVADRQMAADAILLVNEGNQAPYCHYPVYQPPVPQELATAYEYLNKLEFEMPAFGKIRALARDLGGYADVAELEGDITGSIDVDRAVVALGKRLIGDGSLQEDWSIGHFVIGELIGIAIASIAYHNMVWNAQNYGDADMAQTLQAELDAFKQTSEQWKDLLRQGNVADQSMYANY